MQSLEPDSRLFPLHQAAVVHLRTCYPAAVDAERLQCDSSRWSCFHHCCVEKATVSRTFPLCCRHCCLYIAAVLHLAVIPLYREIVLSGVVRSAGPMYFSLVFLQQNGYTGRICKVKKLLFRPCYKSKKSLVGFFKIVLCFSAPNFSKHT